MKDHIKGTIKITPDQLKELLADHLGTIINVPINHYVDLKIGSLSEYSDSTVEFTVKHDDERENRLGEIRRGLEDTVYEETEAKR